MKKYCGLLGLVVMVQAMCMHKEQQLVSTDEIPCTHYQMKHYDEERKYFLALPWTIPPVFVRHYTKNASLDASLCNPQEGEHVLPNAQLWVFNQHKFVLAEAFGRTHDTTYLLHRVPAYDALVFDGVNHFKKSVFACKHYSQSSAACYSLYLLTHSSPGLITRYQGHKEMLKGKGNLASLMLEKERNRIIYTVDQGIPFCYRLKIKDIVENNEDPLQGACYCVGSFCIDVLFKKIISIARDKYLGITSLGRLYYCIFNNKEDIEYSELQLPPNTYVFQDISVDATISKEDIYTHNIALLTRQGEVYTGYFDTFDTINLLYNATVERPEKVFRLYFNAGKLAVVYKDEKSVVEWNVEKGK